jgi:hypothetical protein
LATRIPSEIGELVQLETLLLNDNLLNSSIPTHIGTYLYINSINLSTSLDSYLSIYLSHVGKLSKLSTLQLYNNLLTFRYLCIYLLSISKLLITITIYKHLYRIPTEIGDMRSLRYIGLDGNRLYGTIPTEIGDLSHVLSFIANNNLLVGRIPTEFGLLNESLQV